MISRIYNVYIMKQLALATLLITASLTSIVWLTQALRFIDYIVNRGVTVGTFLYLTSLLIPSLLMLILPVALFCAVLFTYNKLIADSELVVFSTSGLSRWQLIQPVVQVGAVCALLCYLISMVLLPISYREFKEMQTYLRDHYASLLLQEGVFNNPVPGLTVFVRERDSDGMLRGLLVHDSRDPERAVTMMAQAGTVEDTPTGPRFMLLEGNRQEMRNGTLQLLRFERYAVDIGFYVAEETMRQRKPEEYFVPELLKADSVTPQGRAMLVEAHHRLTWPLYNIGLGLFGVVMLMTGEFNRRGNGRRIFAASISALVIVIVAIGLQNLTVRNPVLIPLMYINLIGLAGLSALFAPERNRGPSGRMAGES